MLRPFLNQYGRDMMNEFYLYWSEWDNTKTKMKWQKEATWDTARRLARWAKNSSKFDNQQFNSNGNSTNNRLKQVHAGTFTEEQFRAISEMGRILAEQNADNQ